MIIYLDEDNSYLSWVRHHRDGFVLEWLRKPTRRCAVLHRATCSKIRDSKSKKTHWTTGRRLKACSLDLAELSVWAEQESGHAVQDCEDCRPRNEVAVTNAKHGRITKLGREILDYVIESAVIYLDNPDSPYNVTVGDVANCLDKSTAQVASAMLRLIQSGHLSLDKSIETESDVRGKHRVFPTPRALKTLPAFESLSTNAIERELAGLSEV